MSRAAALVLDRADPAWPRLRQAIRELPQNPRSVKGPKNWLNGAMLFADYLATVPPRMNRWTAPLRRYPDAFEKVRFESRDGTRLSGWLGLAPALRGGRKDSGEEREGLILLPGLYTSKDNYRIRARSERILREWGFHTLTLDLRGVGESERTYSTPGWKEAEDIAAAVEYFRSRANVRRVHLYAESLAASAAIVAAGEHARRGARLLDGRILVMSPFANARTVVDLYSTLHPERSPLGKDFTVVQKFFNILLRLQGYKGGRFDAYVREGARHYRVSLEEAFRRSSAEDFVGDVNVPLLVVHSDDDGLVPVSEAATLARKANGNGNVDVWVLPWGYHCLYEMGDPDWYWGLLSRVFEATTETFAGRAEG